MNVALRRTMTLDDFLIWEAEQPERYEYDGFGPVAMNGGTVAHATIGTNLVWLLLGSGVVRPVLGNRVGRLWCASKSGCR